MSVYVIDTIKPKNNGSFPVVEAADVAVTGSKRLPAALDEKANAADLADLSAAIAGKASQSTVDALIPTVNSKASQSSVDTINATLATKANQSSLDSINANMALKANKADLDITNAHVATKAESADLVTAVNNLQGQIDQIEIDASAEAEVAPEVVAARVDENGTSHATLKARIDYSDTQLNAKLLSYTGGTKNIANINNISSVTGLTISGSEISGKAEAFSEKTITINDTYEGVHTLSFMAYTEADQAEEDTTGLRIYVDYSDTTNSTIVIGNNVTTYTKFTLNTDASKIISQLRFTFGNRPLNTWHVKELQLEAGAAATDYVPPTTMIDSVARNSVANIPNIYETKANAEAEKAELEKKIEKDIKRRIYVDVPEGFSWKNNPLNGKIYTDGDTNFIIDNFDIASYKNAGGVTYYVDPNNGDDNANNGLSKAKAYQTISKAYTRSDVGTIVLCGGVYYRDFGFYPLTVEKSINVIAYKGEKPIVTTASGSVLQPYGGYANVYYASRGSVSSVVDMKVLDKYGEYTKYVKKDTIAEVSATAGSFAHIDGVMYVHTANNREPDLDILYLTSGNNLFAEGNPTLYIEGVEFIGGNSPLYVTNTENATNPKVFAKNCNFYFSETINNDVCMLQGTELSIFENCVANNGQKDGFNYHSKNGIIPKAIEINCTGNNNGNSEDGNDQGSTIHDTGSIIRINGVYSRNKGSNIADETVGTESWNLGCVCFASASPYTSQAMNFFAYDDVKMFLDGCIGYGSSYNVGGASDIYIRNPRFTGTLKPENEYSVIYY